MTVTKEYGISEVCWKGQRRYCVVLDGRRSVDLNYARPDVAMRKAESFARGCHKDFVNFQHEPIHFEFRQLPSQD